MNCKFNFNKYEIYKMRNFCNIKYIYQKSKYHQNIIFYL